MKKFSLKPNPKSTLIGLIGLIAVFILEISPEHFWGSSEAKHILVPTLGLAITIFLASVELASRFHERFEASEESLNERFESSNKATIEFRQALQASIEHLRTGLLPNRLENMGLASCILRDHCDLLFKLAENSYEVKNTLIFFFA